MALYKVTKLCSGNQPVMAVKKPEAASIYALFIMTVTPICSPPNHATLQMHLLEKKQYYNELYILCPIQTGQSHSKHNSTPS